MIYSKISPVTLSCIIICITLNIQAVNTRQNRKKKATTTQQQQNSLRFVCPTCSNEYGSKNLLIQHHETHIPYHYIETPKGRIYKTRLTLIKWLKRNNKKNNFKIQVDTTRRPFIINLINKHLAEHNTNEPCNTHLAPLPQETNSTQTLPTVQAEHHTQSEALTYNSTTIQEYVHQQEEPNPFQDFPFIKNERLRYIYKTYEDYFSFYTSFFE